MNSTTLRTITRSLAAIATVAIFAACAYDAPTSYGDGTSPKRDLLGDRPVDLGSCDSLAVTDASLHAFDMFGVGVQIYRWDGATWRFVAPRADLYGDAAGNGLVGTHFGGPTWKSKGGSSVVGTTIRRCTPDANSIPWLLLTGTPDGEPGVFEKVKLLQRLQTVGGNAPSTPGSVIGEVREVAYTALYRFYQSQ